MENNNDAAEVMSVEEYLHELRSEIDTKVSTLRGLKFEKAGREISLVITNLQQARLWLGEAMKVEGFVQPYPTPVKAE